MKNSVIYSNVIELSTSFQKEFYNNVYPKININSLEKIRKKQLLKLVLICLAFIFIFVLNYKHIIFLSLFLIVLYLVYHIIATNFYNHNILMLKNTYYKQIVECMGLQWKKGTKEPIDNYMPQINKSKMFIRASHIVEDDIIYGNYNGVNIKISDAKILEAGDRTSYHSPFELFKGIVVYFDFNKNIAQTTLIKPKIDFLYLRKLNFHALPLLFSILGAIIFVENLKYTIETGNLDLGILVAGLGFFLSFGYWFLYETVIEDYKHLKDLQKINVEDSRFSKKYQAYSYGQVEGRYLLSTAFIDRFFYISKIYKNNSIRCAFVDDKFIMIIPTKRNSFEVGNLFKPAMNLKDINLFFQQISAILILIEYFKLNENTKL